VKRILQKRGFKVYGSPRRDHSTPQRERWNYIRQAVGYILWRAGIGV
jgi:hypothetical protein